MQRLTIQPHLAERAYNAIVDAICSGQFAPGQRLTQEQLAATLDVSRQPILQALVLLRKQGFIQQTGRRGIVVVAARSGIRGPAVRGAQRARRARLPRGGSAPARRRRRDAARRWSRRVAPRRVRGPWRG